MIAFIEGNILFLEANSAVIDVRGVGYQLLLSKKDLECLVIGHSASFHVHTHVREDALELFGFQSRPLKQIFQLLISVSGVGPKLALGMISVLTAQQIVNALIEKDIALLSSVPGIGKKTAERLSLELKEKALKIEFAFPPSDIKDQGTLLSLNQAIRGLGYSKPQSDWALAKLGERDLIDLSLEDLIKKAITLLTGPK